MACLTLLFRDLADEFAHNTKLEGIFNKIADAVEELPDMNEMSGYVDGLMDYDIDDALNDYTEIEEHKALVARVSWLEQKVSPSAFLPETHGKI